MYLLLMLTGKNVFKWRFGQTSYWCHGSGADALVVLHGGPGFPHYYLQNLSDLASDNLRVVFYDQLGCGDSPAPTGFSDWSVELFVEELELLREAVGLSAMHLLGHSWGGSLAIEYALAYPQKTSSLILSSPLVDSSLWSQGARKLQDCLPGDQGERMRAHEEAGTTESEEYQRIYDEYLLRHDCSLDPLPEDMLLAREKFGTDVYNAMWGPSESHASGLLKDWSCLDRLDQIKLPVLVLSGSKDSATPEQVGAGVNRLQDVRWQIFPAGTHNLHLEQPEVYLPAVSAFLTSQGCL